MKQETTTNNKKQETTLYDTLSDRACSAGARRFWTPSSWGLEPWNGRATVGTHNWERLQRCRPSQTWFSQVINQPLFRLIQAPRVPMNRSASNMWQNHLRDTASRRLSYLDSMVVEKPQQARSKPSEPSGERCTAHIQKRSCLGVNDLLIDQHGSRAPKRQLVVNEKMTVRDPLRFSFCSHYSPAPPVMNAPSQSSIAMSEICMEVDAIPRPRSNCFTKTLACFGSRSWSGSVTTSLLVRMLSSATAKCKSCTLEWICRTACCSCATAVQSVQNLRGLLRFANLAALSAHPLFQNCQASKRDLASATGRWARTFRSRTFSTPRLSSDAMIQFHKSAFGVLGLTWPLPLESSWYLRKTPWQSVQTTTGEEDKAATCKT